MAGNKFDWPKFEDHKVLGPKGTLVGEVRLKASGISWRPKGSHSWHRVTLEQFAEYAVKNGRKQTK